MATTTTTCKEPYCLLDRDSDGRWVLLRFRFGTLAGARSAARELVRSASDYGVARSFRVCRLQVLADIGD